MHIIPESVKEAIRFFGIVLMVIFNNHVRDELINQPRKMTEPGWLNERYEINDRPVEIKCTWTLIYEGKRPKPCPIESYASYRLYKGWKRRNGL